MGRKCRAPREYCTPTKLGLANVQMARKSQKASQTQRLILCLFISCFGYCPSEERPGQLLLGAKLSPALKCVSLGWCGENGLSGMYMGCVLGFCRTWEYGQCGAQMCRILGHLPSGDISRHLPGLLGQ